MAVLIKFIIPILWRMSRRRQLIINGRLVNIKFERKTPKKNEQMCHIKCLHFTSRQIPLIFTLGRHRQLPRFYDGVLFFMFHVRSLQHSIEQHISYDFFLSSQSCIFAFFQCMFDGHWGRKGRDNDTARHRERERERQKSAGCNKYVTRAIAIAQPEIRCFCAFVSCIYSFIRTHWRHWPQL